MIERRFCGVRIAADGMNVDLAAILLKLGFSKIQKWGMQN
jgi:hypothetical protein